MKTTGKYKLFSFRKKYIDALAVMLMPITFLFHSNAPTAIIILFIVFGLWNLIRKPVLSEAYKQIFIVGFLILVYILISALMRGLLTNEWNGLNDVFPIYLILIIPAIYGLSLTQNSMGALVLGCRTATLLFSIISIYLLLERGMERNGFGTNPLISGYLLLIFACISRFNVKKTEERWLGLTFFYLGSLNAISTGSRVIILFYILAIFLDTLFLVRSLIKKDKEALRMLSLLAVLSTVFVIFCYIFGDILRLEDSLNAVISLDILSDSSINWRVRMWGFGLDRFLQNPLFGIGAANIHDELKLHMVNVYDKVFAARHLHNAFVHEIVSLGAIGSILVFLFHYLVYKNINVFLTNSHERLSFHILVLGIIIYDLTGSHLSDDRMTLLTIFVFAVLLKNLAKSKL